MDTQYFSNIDLEKWLRVKAVIKAETGIAVDQDAGTQSAKGITISWLYDAGAEKLVVSLVKREFFDPPASVIDSDIRDLANNA
jgi:hypothetical protein